MEQLLTQFIIRKSAQHKGPSLKVRRAKRNELPWEKYTATVLALTSFGLRDTAKMLKVSYGLVKKWRTEPRFKKLIKEHRQEFVDIVINHVKERVKNRMEKIDDILGKSIEEIASTASYPSLGYDEFKDGDTYSRELISEMFEVLTNMTHKIIEKAENLSLVDLLNEYSLPNELSGVLDALMFSRKDDEYIRKQRQRCKRERRIFDRINLQLMIRIVMHKDFNEEGKKAIVYSLSAMKKKVEEEAKEISKELEKEANKKTRQCIKIHPKK